MPDNFFGLTFKGAGGLPSVPEIDPEVQRILAARQAAADQASLLTPPPDPYAGKGFGGQFVQELKDELTGGAERRQQQYANQVEAVKAKQEAQRLGYVDRTTKVAERNATTDEGRFSLDKGQADRINAAIDSLPAGVRGIVTLNHVNATPDITYSPKELDELYTKIANAKRIGENVAAGGLLNASPPGQAGPASFGVGGGGAAPPPDMPPPSAPTAPSAPAMTTTAPPMTATPAAPPRLLTGLTPVPQTGAGPMDVSFAPTPPPRQTMGPMFPITPPGGTPPPPPGPTTAPRVIGQQIRPLAAGQMIGDVAPNPEGGSLQREIALKTALEGPQGVQTMGRIAELQATPHQTPVSQTPEYAAAKEYNVVKNRVDQLRKPIDAVAEKADKLTMTLTQGGNQADSLAAPQLLTIMAGGLGSGLRMSESEINRIVHARTFMEDLQVAYNKYTASPKNGFQLSAQQRADMHKLIGAIASRAREQTDLIQQADQDLLKADTQQEIRTIGVNLQRDLENLGRAGSDAMFHAVDGSGKDHAFASKAEADEFKAAVTAAGGTGAARPSPTPTPSPTPKPVKRGGATGSF